MMDIFLIPRNENGTLQQCQYPFIFKFIIKFIKNHIQISMNVDCDEARIFHLSFVQNPKLCHEKETIDTDHTTDFFLDKIYSMDELPTSQAMIYHF